MFRIAMTSLIVASFACGGAKIPAAQPAAPAATELHTDVVTFCSAEAAEHATGLPDLGPFLEPRLHDTEVKQLMNGLRDGSVALESFHERIRALTTGENVSPCPTLDRLFAQKTPAE